LYELAKGGNSMLGRIEVWELAKARGYKFSDELTDCDEIEVPSMDAARQLAQEIAQESGVIEEYDDEIVVYEPDGWTFIIVRRKQ
jgi:hypothetical protein